MTTIRRLAAIMAADVAGYSRLIGTDEAGTLDRFRAIRAEVIDPAIAAHNGRVVKTTGDGLLVEFSSVVDALHAATKIQAAMAERNAPVPQDRRIEFRIGLNVGDVVVEDGDIFGDGVNVAARLEGLAEPGGISVSARVQEDAAGELWSRWCTPVVLAPDAVGDRYPKPGLSVVARRWRGAPRRMDLSPNRWLAAPYPYTTRPADNAWGSSLRRGHLGPRLAGSARLFAMRQPRGRLWF